MSFPRRRESSNPCHSRAGGNPELSSFRRTAALHIQRALQKANGTVHGPGGAAAILGINPSTLRSKMKKLGIHYGRKRG
ncbi:MAG: helix-turn-helix domain-containing protein [Syntrophales bacterium]